MFNFKFKNWIININLFTKFPLPWVRKRAYRWKSLNRNKKSTPGRYSAKTPLFKKLTTRLNLFLLYLEYSQLPFTFFYSVHMRYKLIFNLISDKNLMHINLTQCLQKWSLTISLFLNFGYFNIKALSFGNRFLWKETLSLNWQLLNTKTMFFNKLNSSIFIKDSPWIEDLHDVFKRFQLFNIENAFLWDLNSHKNHSIYLKEGGFFTIGLTPLNSDPWKVGFSIPIFSQNLLIQYYFLTTYVYTFSLGKSLYYNWLKKVWYLAYL